MEKEVFGRQKEMKCPKCRKEMTKKKTLNNVYYYECMKCYYSIGKPAKESEPNGKEEGKEEAEKTN